MKRILMLPLLLCLFLAACKDEDEPEPVLSNIDADIKKQVKSASGAISTKPVSAIIHIWPAEDADFDVEASGTELYIGSAYDRNSGEYKTAKYGSIGTRMKEPVEPGRYFIYVLLMKSSDSGSLAYSYTYFDIKESEKLVLKKTFSHDVPSGAFEEWDKNK